MFIGFPRLYPLPFMVFVTGLPTQRYQPIADIRTPGPSIVTKRLHEGTSWWLLGVFRYNAGAVGSFGAGFWATPTIDCRITSIDTKAAWSIVDRRLYGQVYSRDTSRIARVPSRVLSGTCSYPFYLHSRLARLGIKDGDSDKTTL